MAVGGRRRGALEQEVLGSLAAAGRPLTVAEVLADLGDDLAYTTVMTALSRLHAKGVLTREPAGRAFAYSLPADPAAMGASVTARRMSRLLGSGQDRAGVLARFVADLTPEDEQLLTELLTDGHRRVGEGRS
jgi:predicted transcriptional regulator